jgi:hypothetical protein
VRYELVPPTNGKPGKRLSALPFEAYLEKRWREGEHQAVQLCQEIKKLQRLVYNPDFNR